MRTSIINTIGLIYFGPELAYLITFRATGLIPEIPELGIRYGFVMSETQLAPDSRYSPYFLDSEFWN